MQMLVIASKSEYNKEKGGDTVKESRGQPINGLSDFFFRERSSLEAISSWLMELSDCSIR